MEIIDINFIKITNQDDVKKYLVNKFGIKELPVCLKFKNFKIVNSTLKGLSYVMEGEYDTHNFINIRKNSEIGLILWNEDLVKTGIYLTKSKITEEIILKIEKEHLDFIGHLSQKDKQRIIKNEIIINSTADKKRKN